MNRRKAILLLLILIIISAGIFIFIKINKNPNDNLTKTEMIKKYFCFEVTDESTIKEYYYDSVIFGGEHLAAKIEITDDFNYTSTLNKEYTQDSSRMFDNEYSTEEISWWTSGEKEVKESYMHFDTPKRKNGPKSCISYAYIVSENSKNYLYLNYFW